MMTRIVHKFSGWLEIIAGAALMIVMLLSGADVVGRAFGRPIPGAYEVISFAGGLVLGFAIPASAIGKVHVIVDLVIAKLPPGPRAVLHFVSRLMGAGLLCAAGYALITMGSKLRVTGEVTPVLQLPFYPIAYAMGFAFLVTTLVLLLESVTKGGANA
ncbi:MAG: Tripartite ATP-independent periplasmic transporter [Syntrophorhabdus sp. PtaB.Bin184]|nr:MAG: Tripartite ATP-independent periplasmic transporter [Syntrophorhabdus sp. PtaB.Bin184]